MGGIKLMKNKTAIHPEDSFSVKVVNETEYGVWVECSRCGTNTFIEYNNILPVRCSYCEVFYEDVRFGDSGSVYIYNEIDEVNEWHVAGILCDMEMNEKYIPVYCDH
jgi:hypothetical protein